MQVTLEKIADFIFQYIRRYRQSYERATASPPHGPGYPKLPISPFLLNGTFNVYVTRDGVAINHLEPEPTNQWYIVGGPAICVDYKATRKPLWVLEHLAANDLIGKNLGIYRIVSETELPSNVWQGKISSITRKITLTDHEVETTLILKESKGSLKQLVSSLTFGAYGEILDIHLPDKKSPLGEPIIVKNLGIFPADLNHRRYFSHLEIHGQSDPAAWDIRGVNYRVQCDIRRDLARALANPKPSDGFIGYAEFDNWLEQYSNRLELLSSAINALRSALQNQSNEVEAVFHNVIVEHPLLLDVYGTCESKPRFTYPQGKKSPIGKSSLEPDFLIKYADKSYKLIEIERPSKLAVTIQGQPRAEVSQATFQTAEWSHYIKTHYQELHDRYPGIQSSCKFSVIMSRTNQQSFINIEEIDSYKGLIMEQFKIDEFLTFDDLYDRACAAYSLLSGLPH